MSQCTECGSPMHAAEASTYENCRNCRKGGKVRHVKTLHRARRKSRDNWERTTEETYQRLSDGFLMLSLASDDDGNRDRDNYRDDDD